MAYDEANLSSTPLGYATPEQLKSLREYAKVLMTPGQIRPLAHWAPALSDAIGGLMGGYGLHRAGEREKETLDWAGGRQVQGITEATTPGVTPGAPARPSGSPRAELDATPGAPAPGGGLGSAVAAYAPPSAGSGDPLDPATHSPRLGGFESGGRYDKLGPVINNGGMYHGDRAYGKYQVMGKNIPEWTQAALGRPMTPQEFLANSDAQEAVFKHRFGQYLKQTGNPEDAASMWFTGRPVAQARAAGARDQLGTTVDKYVANTVGGRAAPPPAALPFASTGEVPTGQQPDLPGEVVPPLSFADRGSPVTDPPPYREAAARGAAPAAAPRPGGPGAAVSPPIPTVTGTPGLTTAVQLPPGLIQPRGAPSPDVLKHLLGLAAPYSNPAVTGALTQMYMNRNQPQQLKTAFGDIIVPPGSPTQGHFVPTPQTIKGAHGPGGIAEADETGVYDPYTQTFKRIGVGSDVGAPIGIPSPPGASTARPNTPPPSVPTLPRIGPARPPGGTGPRSDVPALQTGPETAGIPDLQTGPQTAGLEEPPADQAMAFAGVPAEEGAQGISSFSPNLLNTMPPAISQGPKPTPAAATPPVQMAQAGGARPRRTMEDLIETGRQYEADKEYDKEDIKSYQKQYDLMATAGSTAKSLIPQLELARMLVDKGVIQGIGADPRLDWNRALELFGSAEAAKKAGISQAFEKLISGSILTEMKTTLQGLGQVRVAEIELLKNASASRYNTPEANKAILDLQLRTANMIADAKAVSEAYKNGVRWDAEGNPIVDANGNAVLHRGRPDRGGMDAVVSRLMENHPMRMTPEQHEQYLNIFAQADQRLGKERTGGRGVERPTPQAAPQPQGGGGRPSLDTFNR